MNGRLNEILAEPISDDNEALLMELIKRKITSAARLAVRLLHAMEERFGPEARQVVREMIDGAAAPPRPQPGDPAADLHEFCDQLERACVGSHRWRRAVDEPDRIGYEFTRCLYAEIFRELGEPELGFMFCAGDDPAVRAFNPDLGFRRTKVLMNGDEICDHVFLVEKDETPR